MTRPDPTTAPFGAFAPGPLARAWIGATRALSWRWGARRLAALGRVVLGWRGQKLFDVEVHGSKMRLALLGNAADRNALFLPRFQDPDMRAEMERRLKPGGVFVDVGANVGVYSCLGARLVGAEGTVVAVEPQPPIHARLATNLALNGYAQVRRFACAVGANEGTAVLTLSESNAGQASLDARVVDGGSGRGVEVRLRPLAAVLAEAGVTRVDALKIDVEGLEGVILLPYLDETPIDRRPKAILVEYSPDRWGTDVVAALVERGYRVTHDKTANWTLERA